MLNIEGYVEKEREKKNVNTLYTNYITTPF